MLIIFVSILIFFFLLFLYSLYKSSAYMYEEGGRLYYSYYIKVREVFQNEIINTDLVLGVFKVILSTSHTKEFIVDFGKCDISSDLKKFYRTQILSMSQEYSKRTFVLNV